MKDLRSQCSGDKHCVHIKGGMTYVAEYFWREFV